ncbi:MAG: ABC transporter ATP-binding protein [Rubrivivax sp.]|nr:ABC transporter ATP-binding protein [Rubrivivax sp.]
MSEPVLRLAGISKRFGSLVANDDISLVLNRGEVLALLGENGAGKSTLVSILFGHYEADAGRIEVEGHRLPPGQPRAALAAGIGMVHQHSTLADNLSVLDNVMLGTEPLWRPWSRREAARRALVQTAARFGLAVVPEARVAMLGVGERQRVEILKALVRGARILILDEPTAVLTPQESESLFATLAQMVAEGLAIIFISHKLAEVQRVSHRVVVLRGGRVVAQAKANEASAAQLAAWMVGHAVESPLRTPAADVGAPVCELEGVCTGRGAGSGRDRLDNVSLTLRGGEIVAVAGVSGNGQAALAGVLCGTHTVTAGRLRYLGAPMPAEPAARVAGGVARIPEDRQGTGVIGDLPLWENAASERLAGDAFSRRFLGLRWIRRRAARAFASRIVERFDVRGGGLDAPVRLLSGGNMQKLILGRALAVPAAATPVAPAVPGPRLIVAHQPTWGLDVGAVAAVQRHLIAARDAGAAVLVISDDLDEVLALGDRVAVMHDGHLGQARPGPAWTRAAIGLAMAGARADGDGDGDGGGDGDGDGDGGAAPQAAAGPGGGGAAQPGTAPAGSR